MEFSVERPGETTESPPGSQTLDGAVDPYPARQLLASGNGAVLRPKSILALTAHGPVRIHPTQVTDLNSDGAESPIEVFGCPPPTRRGAVGAETAGHLTGGVDGAECAVGRFGLAIVVVSPAGDGAVGAQAAGVRAADGDVGPVSVRLAAGHHGPHHQQGHRERHDDTGPHGNPPPPPPAPTRLLRCHDSHRAPVSPRRQASAPSPPSL